MKTGDKIRFVRNTERSVSVTIGKVYTVTKMEGGDPHIINDNNVVGWYTGSQFDMVADELEDNLKNNIVLAKSLIGKLVRIKSNGDTFVPIAWGIGNEFNEHLSLRENENQVYLENDSEIAIIDDIEVVTNVLKLTSEYNAIIEKDVVKVGCQTIPIETVKELVRLWEELHGDD